MRMFLAAGLILAFALAILMPGPASAETSVAFSPATNATTGKTVKITANATPTSVAGTLTANVNNVLVTNAGTVLVFVRMSGEATPTATNSDVPMTPGSSRIFQNPAPNGTSGLAVLSSTTTASDVYFTPGEGGID